MTLLWLAVATDGVFASGVGKEGAGAFGIADSLVKARAELGDSVFKSVFSQLLAEDCPL